MILSNLPGCAAAQKAIEANLSPRAQYLGMLERYVEGTQYEGQPDWFDKSVPLFERAPCIVYTLTRSATNSNTDFVLGESRWPRITARPAEDDAEFDDLGLSLEDSAILDKFMLEVQRQSRFKSVAREAFTSAQSCGSAVAIFGAVGGELRIETTRTRWCQPEMNPDGSVKRLVIQYPYLEQYREQGGGPWKVRARLYRRVVDDQYDTTFLPADASRMGVEPNWRPDPTLTVRHGFNFCPVVWYSFMSGAGSFEKVDGHAIHEHLLDEIRALDMALSMRHRAALYASDPQWTEVGVDEGFTPTATGDVTALPATIKGGPVTSENRPVGEYRGGKREQGRKKGPGEVWQYPDPQTKITLHTLPGDALTSISEHIKDLRVKLGEGLSVVFLDLEAVKFASALSGKALDLLRERQLDRCEQYRDDFGQKFILPAVGMLLRLVRFLGPALRVTGLKKTSPILQKFDLEQWRPPSISVLWGPFFRPDTAEQQLTVAMVVQAWVAGGAGNLITRRMALEKLKEVFPYESEEAILQQLDEEAEARQKGDPELQVTPPGGAEDKLARTTGPKAESLEKSRAELGKKTPKKPGAFSAG
jgi:hypothetical protein